MMRIPRILRTLLEKAGILSRSNEDAPLLSSRELAEPLYCAISISSKKEITLSSFDIIAIVSGFLSNDAESLLALRRTSRNFNMGVAGFYRANDTVFPRFSGLTQTLCNSSEPIVLLNNNGSQFIKLGTLEELNIVEESISAARLLSYLILGMNHPFPKPEKAPASEEYETQLNDYKKLRYKLRVALMLSLILFLGSAPSLVFMCIKNGGELMLTVYNVKDGISADNCLSASNSDVIDSNLTISCNALRAMPAADASWPAQAIYDCFSDGPYSPWPVQTLLQDVCDRFAERCTSLITASLFSGSFLHPDSDISYSYSDSQHDQFYMYGNLGVYCSKGVSVGFFFLFLILVAISAVGFVAACCCLYGNIKNVEPVPALKEGANTIRVSLNGLFRKERLAVTDDTIQSAPGPRT